MRNYIQETSSKKRYSLPLESTTPFGSYSYPYLIEQSKAQEYFSFNLLHGKSTTETFGGAILNQYVFITKDLIDISILDQIENPEVVKVTNKVLSIINELSLSFNYFGIDLGNIPPKHIFKTEDDAIIIEWTHSDFRVGFNIEQNQEDSGWYLITNERLGEISASGYITGIDIKSLTLWLYNFIISNY